ncbi:MAG: dimethylsulfoniopropionate demethylase [Acidiferrobacteraceae bacterium]|nr:dimethylsulfoniopropionate demethylase [Acidiferrobacteraceae bacterium]
MYHLTPSIRLRRTPFTRRVSNAGVQAYTVYNHMLLASYFRSVEEDYSHLKRAVQIWDVSCERQVELYGPDAAKLLQLTTPRNLEFMHNDQCYYIPMVDESGYMLNDPVAIRLASDRFWVSLADSDMLYYFKGLANGFGLNVHVFEPDISPLAIQGPLAETLISNVFGDKIRTLKFFRHRLIHFQDKEMVIARSGWSHQGGFEIYVEGSGYGEPLWDCLFEAGQSFDVRAGCPNNIERIEAGLLSYGSDITTADTPFEAGLGRYCDLGSATECLATKALLEKQSPNRQIRPIEIHGPPLSSLTRHWPLSDGLGNSVGQVSSSAWSPDLKINVAIGMVGRKSWKEGSQLLVETEEGSREAIVQNSFWT